MSPAKSDLKLSHFWKAENEDPEAGIRDPGPPHSNIIMGAVRGSACVTHHPSDAAPRRSYKFLNPYPFERMNHLLKPGRQSIYVVTQLRQQFILTGCPKTPRCLRLFIADDVQTTPTLPLWLLETGFQPVSWPFLGLLPAFRRSAGGFRPMSQTIASRTASPSGSGCNKRR